jgi:hypothetical protein
LKRPWGSYLKKDFSRERLIPIPVKKPSLSGSVQAWSHKIILWEHIEAMGIVSLEARISES